MSPGPRHRLIRAIGLALAHLACCSLVSASTVVDPALRFRTLSTEHFRIHFHQGGDRLAHRLAAIAEDMWPKIGRAIGAAPPRLTHVILADQSELANGWATPLPYDTVFITMSAPAGSEFIGRTDDWLRLVFIHEFTHIVHLDRSAGWSRAFHGIFGRTPLAFPNLWLPSWMIEGLAEWQESALTGEGRLHAGDFRAVEREAARAGRVEPLDRVNGELTDWPAGLAPYAFGLGFHEYLADRFGAGTFAAMVQRTTGSLPFLGTSAFNDVYGSPLGALWKDYAASVTASSGRLRARESTLAVAPHRLTYHGHTVVGPRFVPAVCDGCPQEIAYSLRTPHALPALRMIGTDGAASRQLAVRYLGSTVTATAGTIVFDQQEVRRNVGVYSDLYTLDRAKGTVKPLTRDLRLQDPDLSPDGLSIACVREEQGRRDLLLLPMADGRVGQATLLVSEPDTQFSAPRWSPDGRSVAVMRHQLGAQSEIVILDVATSAVRVLASDPEARIVTPAWRPDGLAVIAAADYDAGAFNLYEFSATDPSAAPRQLTATSGGALWPDVSSDGRNLVFAGYTVDGFDLFLLPYPSHPPAVVRSRPDVPPLEPVVAAPALDAVEVRPYSAWPTLAPTSWSPLIETGTAVRAGFSTGGADVLGHHAYLASATWLVNAPDRAHTPGPARPDWEAAYAYDRWRPTLFVSLASSTLFSASAPDSGGHSTPVTIRAREIEAGMVLPVRHVRASHRAFFSLARTSDEYTFPIDVPSRSRSALRLGVSTTTAHTFGYSISPERGLTLGMTTELASRTFGVSGGAATATVDARAYLPGLASHHVAALRAAGGVVLGTPGLGRTFVLGGSETSGGVLDFGTQALSLMRGFPANSFAGNRVAVLNADYRLPLTRPQRGLGIWPIFLHTVHGAVFGDVGETWIDRFRIEDLKTSVGGEIAADLVAGYSFRFTTTVGAAWGHNMTDGVNRATFYVRIGRAF